MIYNERNQIYLQSKSSIESSHRISKPRKNPNSNLYNLVIGFCHQSCAFWRIGLNGYQLLLLGTSKSGFAKRKGKDGLLMHAPIPAIFSLFILPLSFFLSVLSLLLVFYYSPAVHCSPFVIFPFLGSLSVGAYYSLTVGFPPLSASLHWISLFRCFSLFPCFSFSSSVFSPPFCPFFLPSYHPFIAN